MPIQVLVVPRTFRAICYLCAFSCVAMGAFLIGFPQLVTRIAGPLHPAVYGVLRGCGGSILPYGLLYVLVALDPARRRWAMGVILLANVVAIVLDVASVMLGEYTWAQAMLDIPLEAVSAAAMLIALRAPWARAAASPT